MDILRVITAVNLRVAIQAPPCQRISFMGSLKHARNTLMRIRFMAFLTKEGITHFEQIGGSCAVGIVANGTVFLNRRMITHKWPAFFHMACVAGIVNTVPDRHAGPG